MAGRGREGGRKVEPLSRWTYTGISVPQELAWAKELPGEALPNELQVAFQRLGFRAIG